MNYKLATHVVPCRLFPLTEPLASPSRFMFAHKNNPTLYENNNKISQSYGGKLNCFFELSTILYTYLYTIVVHIVVFHVDLN